MPARSSPIPSPAFSPLPLLCAALSFTAGAFAAPPPQAATDPAPVINYGAAKAFSFDALVKEAKEMAAGPYGDGAPPRAEKAIEKIDYDAFNKIKFRPENTLKIGTAQTPIRLFHLQKYAKKSVHISVVENGKSREVLYTPEFFDMPADSPAKALPKDIGFAGFHVMEQGKERDFMAFMGAAYFRTSGELDQFGLSARAAAIDTAMDRPEEFPRFTSFYFEPSSNGVLTVYALMDSPSLTGAVRFDVQRTKGVLMDINSRFFARKDIKRFGLAPLTSMFWYSEYSRRLATDWRPEIHDSDGLAIWSGNGERLWRPLNNPSRVMTSSFFMNRGVRGFGLLQRDRDFDHYQDDWVSYHLRPTCWVEPTNDWGPGAVQLVEIPTDDEIYDNIVAYWVSDKPVKTGDAVSVDYRLHWTKEEPFPAKTTGVVYSCRTGAGGVAGAPRPPGVVKFIVDFEGGPLGSLTIKDGVDAVVSASQGKINGTYCVPVTGTTRWRAGFDLTPSSLDPVELRLFLKRKDTALTETWLSQYHPTVLPPAANKAQASSGN